MGEGKLGQNNKLLSLAPPLRQTLMPTNLWGPATCRNVFLKVAKVNLAGKLPSAPVQPYYRLYHLLHVQLSSVGLTHEPFKPLHSFWGRPVAVAYVHRAGTGRKAQGMSA